MRTCRDGRNRSSRCAMRTTPSRLAFGPTDNTSASTDQASGIDTPESSWLAAFNPAGTEARYDGATTKTQKWLDRGGADMDLLFPVTAQDMPVQGMGKHRRTASGSPRRIGVVRKRCVGSLPCQAPSVRARCPDMPHPHLGICLMNVELHALLQLKRIPVGRRIDAHR